MSLARKHKPPASTVMTRALDFAQREDITVTESTNPEAIAAAKHFFEEYEEAHPNYRRESFAALERTLARS